jgi:lysophospholipase L1-like esterase
MPLFTIANTDPVLIGSGQIVSVTNTVGQNVRLLSTTATTRPSAADVRASGTQLAASASTTFSAITDPINVWAITETVGNFTPSTLDANSDTFATLTATRGTTFPLFGTPRLAFSSLRTSAAIARSGGVGCDIVCIGSSLTRGLNDPTHFRTGWVHRLKLLIQGRYNPTSVLGGYGFVRAWDTVGGTRNDSTFQSIAGTVNASSGGTCITRNRLPQNATPRTHKVIYNFDGTAADAVASRRGVTDIEALIHGAGGGNPTTTDGRIDLQIGSAPATTTAGTLQSATINTSEAAATANYPDWRIRYNTGLVATNNNFFQYGNGSSTPGGSLQDFWNAGVIAYNGDWATGVRVHNLGFPGGESGNWGSGDELTCQVDRWATGATTGARNAKLFIVEIPINDYRSAVALATFQTNINNLLNRIQSQPSSPGVLLVIPPMAADAATWASPTAANPSSRSDLARQMVNWVYSLAASRPGTAVVDLIEILGGSFHYVDATDNGYRTALVSRGFNESDLIHWSASMQSWVADGIFGAIATEVG